MERPKIGIGVMIFNEQEVLMMKRKGSHGEGSWCFPGGHLEYGETFRDCARREVREETGLEVYLDSYNPVFVTNDFFEKESKHYVTLFMKSMYNGGDWEIKEPNKCTEIGWFEWGNFPNPLFLPVKNLLAQNYNPFDVQ
jgi:8-oxo-dGTP diphosphatase